MADVNDLLVRIDATTEQLRRELTRAETATAQMADRVNSSLRKIDFESIASKADRAFSFLSKFAAGGAGGLAGVGIGALVLHVAHLAEKLKDVNPGAKELSDSFDHLRESVGDALLSIFEPLAPLIERIAAGLRSAVDAVKAFADVKPDDLNALAETVEALQKKLAATASGPQSGLQGQARATLERQIAETKAELDRVLQIWLARANAGAEALKALTNNEQIEEEEKVAKEIDKIGDQMAKNQMARDKEVADNFRNLLEVRAEEDKALQDDTDERNKKLQDQLKGVGKTLDAASKSRLDEIDKQFEKLQQDADAFGNLFADNLVQAADGGFKAVVKSWELTLEQLLLKTLASDFYKTALGLFNSSGAGGFFSGLLGGLFGGGGAAAAAGSAVPEAGNLALAADGADFMVPGSGSHDSFFAPFMLTPGEHVRITPKGQSDGGGVTFNQNISVGAGASRAEVVAAMKVATNAARAQIRDDIRRGR